MAFPVVLFSADGEQYNTYRDDETGVIFPYGTQLVMQDGRKFRFVRNGATLAVVGDVMQAGLNTANHVNTTAIAASIGSRAPTSTLGATAATVNDYRQGYVIVEVTPDGGSSYVIGSHAAVASSGVMTANLAPGFSLQRAWTTTSRVGYIRNPHRNVIQVPVTTITAPPQGVAVTPLAANGTNSNLSFGWLATSGPCGVLTTGTLVIGQRAVASTAAAGAVAPATGTIATYIVEQVVGRVIRVGATGTFSLIDLSIDP